MLFPPCKLHSPAIEVRSADLVQTWFRLVDVGSALQNAWPCYADLHFKLGADLVQTWFRPADAGSTLQTA